MDRLASFAGCQSRSAYLLRQTATCTLALFALTFLQVTHGASTGPGAVVNDEMCMQEQAGFELNCTANDVRISGIADVSGPMGVPDGIIDENDIAFLPVCDAMASNAGADCSTDPNICMADGSPAPQLCGDRCGYPGDTTRFSTTFIFELSAQERHDVAAYFETAIDTAGDGALTGDCSIVSLPEDNSPFMRPDGTSGNFVDLDTNCKGGGCPQPLDVCGDIDGANSPIYYDMQGAKAVPDTITAQCIDSDGDGFLNFPNCTSWRQSGANDVCLDPTDAFPGSPSKCNCDPGFQLPIAVPAASISVVKTPTPTTVDEPGERVRFDVRVTNNSPFATVTIDNNTHTTNTVGLEDSVFGDITRARGAIESTDCMVPLMLAPSATYSCYFVAEVAGLGDTVHTNTVTASGKDENDNDIAASGDANVSIVDILPTMSLSKTAFPTSVTEPGGNVEFTVTVNNTSSVDALTLTALMDDIYGNLDGQGTCAVPQTIAVGGTYSCSFTQFVSGPPMTSETDVITATASDDEGNVLMPTASATVSILNSASMCTLTKTANPGSLNEPGGNVEFTVLITNDSAADTIDITSLSDSIYGDLNGKGDCSTPQSLAPGGDSYTCSFTEIINAMGNSSETNTMTASGTDDDGAAILCSDSETVNIIDVAPAASLTKEVTQLVATYRVVVRNDSAAEALSLDVLHDDRFGDITYAGHDGIQSTSCATPQSIAVGATYECSFDALVTSPDHTNTVEATVRDDEGNTVTPSDSATVDFE